MDIIEKIQRWDKKIVSDEITNDRIRKEAKRRVIKKLITGKWIGFFFNRKSPDKIFLYLAGLCVFFWSY